MNPSPTNHTAARAIGLDDLDWLGEPGAEHGRWSSERAIVHLVLLDGRLVDTWHEPAEGTRWEHLAQERARPVVQLPRDESQDLLDWLTALCGSSSALGELTDSPLGEPEAEAHRQATSEAPPEDELDELLLRLGDACFDGETVLAMRRAARLLASPRGPRPPHLSAHQRASGIAWAIGRANGLFGPGLLSPGAVQHVLGLTSTISAAGRAVERAIAGPLPLVIRRPSRAPDLLVLGRTDLLLGATRRAVIAWRDQAQAAHAAAAARHPCSLCSPEDVPPSR
ncbi:hypothetical protein [Microlunatus flavus]|uniref:Uncharacterized protein n=1 Tax=Microlunatus flavus TaxID=1036181 RepID=A0A1H9MCK0_9ACTN|nr:hypothetical protein [Microlunatus flavus]SER21352.1 hypothetical protein SAMN05421756_11062 [Microlunatus flavus]